MAARFAEYEGAAAECVRLAETLTFDLGGDLGYRYPGSDDEGATRRLAAICHAEFARRYPASYARRAEAACRLEAELALIDTLGFSGDEGATRRLAAICHAEFARRYPARYARRAEAAWRLEAELALIDTLGFSGVFNLH